MNGFQVLIIPSPSSSLTQALVCIQYRSSSSPILTHLEAVAELRSKEDALLETVPIQVLVNGTFFVMSQCWSNYICFNFFPKQLTKNSYSFTICIVFADDEFSYFLRSCNEYVIKRFINESLQKILATWATTSE